MTKLITIIILLLLAFINYSNAQWSTDPTVNTAICTALGQQTEPQLVSDSSGGAIITWYDNRSGNNDIYAQRINSSGVVQWTANGVAICTAADNQVAPKLVSDGSGGAVITWTDFRSGNNDIYAQRISSSGATLWTANGVAICSAINGQTDPTIISDGSAGAIITWNDERSGNYDIYAQRINSSGATQWTADGVVICNTTDSQFGPQLTSDGSGGAIITWRDNRSGNDDIYAQRINSSGATQWTANGVVICSAINTQNMPQLISDGSGGAIIAWYDGRSGNDDIYAQRINSSGVTQWIANGVAISTAIGNQSEPRLISDDNAGAIITWYDDRSGNSDIYTQKINSSGAPQWTANGVAICTAANNQESPKLISDENGGAIITWYDDRSGILDVYAQRINSSGATQWAANGVAIGSAANIQDYPQLTSDGNGGAIVSWSDERSGVGDIYAQNVSSLGTLGYTSPILTTLPISSITSTMASSGGNITSDGGNSVTARGIVWSLTANPTIALSTKTIDGSGTGSFTSKMTGLTAGSTYYVRAYATNSIGTSYGAEYSFVAEDVDTDGDGSPDYYEELGPNSGDANSDGMSDATQNYVVTLQALNGVYITIESLGKSAITEANVQSIKDSKFYSQLGLFDFKLTANSETVKIYIHSEINLSEYKYMKQSSSGLLQVIPSIQYNKILIAGQIAQTYTFSLVDGGFGDSDGIVNGVIHDPGGPVILAIYANIPTLSEWARIAMLSLMLAFGVYFVRKRLD